MSRVDTLTAAGDGVLAGVQHDRHGGHKKARLHEGDRQVGAVATGADATEKGSDVCQGTVGLLLFSFAAGSPWGPAKRWLLTTRYTDNRRGSNLGGV